MTFERRLQDAIVCAPPPFDAEAVARARAAFEKHPASKIAPPGSRAGALIDGVFGNSPYLTRLILADIDRAARLLSGAPDDNIRALRREVAQSLRVADDREFERLLRKAKQEISLLTAFCDLSGAWSLDQVTRTLSDFADWCVGAALNRLLLEQQRKGRLLGLDPETPDRDSGVAIVAMGKYGARELNYSSDIDIIVFYDPAAMPARQTEDARLAAIQIARDLVTVLQKQTPEGYVFRTDLRLRPNAGSSAAAVSVGFAEEYYEAHGQNWQRASLIKARVSAGDQQVGRDVLNRLRPFVWRKYLDYAAIQDVHSIKRQMHSAKGLGDIRAEGHNIKLGRGGIREIEFFAQTQQLILGGRIASLRTRRTVDALARLAENRLIAANVARELTQSYEFLRTLEHRLQMVEDSQTHELPRQPQAFARIASFCGFQDPADFRTALLAHLRRTHDHYKNLFASEEPLSGAGGSLVFTGVEDDPDTIKTLSDLGFERPSTVAAAIRSWHAGEIRATRSQRARELLTKLMPALVEALASTSHPDTAFVRFHAFLSGLPSSAQVFSLFYAHPRLLNLVASIVGFAPRLGPYLARHPSLIDSLLDPDFFDDLPDAAQFREGLAAALAEAKGVEAKLDAARWWGQAQSFRIGVHVLQGLASARVAGLAFTRLAEAVVDGLLPVAIQQTRERYGDIDGDLAIVALGKLGGGELTATSDLDIMCVYDAAPEARSDSDARIDASQYFLRVVRRLVTALSAPTAEGALYNIDLQLRPSGRGGPIAVRFSAFENYYMRDAWTWELMALTRARVISGSPELKARTEAVIERILRKPRNPRALAIDVEKMRDRIRREKHTDDIWCLKFVGGGIVDLEFIYQYLQLAHASSCPEILHAGARESLRAIGGAGIVSAECVNGLLEATNFLHALLQVTSLAETGRFDSGKLTPALKDMMSQIVHIENFDALENQLRETLAFVARTYEDIVVEAARKAS